jgi:uncharacterized RDD family membrane protein YckC
MRPASGLFSHMIDSIRAQVIRLDQILQGVARCHCCCIRYHKRRRNSRMRRHQLSLEEWGLPPRPGPSSHVERKTFPRQRQRMEQSMQRRNNQNAQQEERERVVTFEQTYPWRRASDLALAVQGRCAGMASRSTAWLVDQGIVTVTFALTWLLVRVAFRMVQSDDPATYSSDEYQTYRAWALTIAWTTWGGIYNFCSWAMVGRTMGMAFMGLLVVSQNGQPIKVAQAVIRAMVMSTWLPVILWSPIGWYRNDRRHVQDFFACTAVIYAWDARSYQLHEAHISEAERLGPEFSTFDIMSA